MVSLGVVRHMDLGMQTNEISHIFVANGPIYMIYGAICSVGPCASFVPFGFVS